MAFARVALKFARLSDDDLITFATTVITEMTGNAAIFASPPVTMAALTGLKNDFAAKLAAAAVGGPADTADKNAARQLLLGALQQTAAYVEMEANGDEPTLLKSGFEKRSTERSSVELEKPEGLTITNEGDGILGARVDPVKSCSMYEGRIKPDGAAEWMDSVFTGDSQNMRFTGLTPGTLYSIQVRALGGSTGASPWSDPAQHRSL